MKRKPVSWATALKQIFSPVRRKPVSSKLAVETLDERIVPTIYNVTNLTDGTTGGGTVAGSLRADITNANNDSTANATETFNLSGGATYSLTIANPQTGHEQKNASGDLNIQNIHGAGIKNYIFNGNGATIDQTVEDRVFEIIGTSTNIKVTFKNLTITGGFAVDNGAAGTIPGVSNSLGGGILNQGASVTLSGVTLVDNIAQGFFGLGGFNGNNATKAGEFPGSGEGASSGAGGIGGGLYSTAGTITIISSTITSNKALGGDGGDGGHGGNVSKTASGSGAPGGGGGNGGNAIGGGIYIVSGNLTMTKSDVNGNSAIAGVGGAGGGGGKEGVKSSTAHGGTGGAGGVGGNAEAGGIYSAAGSVSLTSGEIANNKVSGGAGGVGGVGGSGTAALNNGGFGGNGGNAGSATAGGLFAQLGNVTIKNQSQVQKNSVVGGEAGAGGAGGHGDAKNKTSGGTGGNGGTGGVGGSAFGGGLYVVNGITTVELSSLVNANNVTAGAGGAGGVGGAGKQHFGGNGGNGNAGGSAAGGGLYSGLGTVIVEQNSSVNSNIVKANAGGTGGVGGSVATVAALGGIGGNGGAGGSASGGGIYSKSGTVMIVSINASSPLIKGSSFVDGNEVSGVGGGNGGVGGKDTAKSGSAGAGGNGEAGESFFAGGIYAGNGSVNVTTSFVMGNRIVGVAAGNGGNGGAAVAATAAGANGGNGGAGGVAFGGGIYAAKGTVTIAGPSTTKKEINSNGVTAGAGGNGGTGGHAVNATAGAGGIGGAAGAAAGGGVYAIAGQVVIDPFGLVKANIINGGAGGNGGPGGLNNFNQLFLGGAAGAGGIAEGGGIWASAAAVAVSGAVSSNAARGGVGGIGGTGGGMGGAGANGEGGGIFSVTGAITILNQAKVQFNSALGGAGGSGGNNFGGLGGVGGVGGTGQGGGVFSALGNVSITSSKIVSNLAAGNIGGAGGAGFPGGGSSGAAGGTSGTSSGTRTGGTGGGTKKSASGGNAQGGGIYIGNGNLNLEHANIELNKAGGDLAGGAGGGSFNSTGGSGGFGGDGGDAEGGGIYISSGAVSLTIQDSSVTSNSAGPGGAPGTGGAFSGRDGLGGFAQGGGIYTAANSLILNSTIAYNTAVGSDVATTAQGGGVYVAPIPVGSLGGTTINNSTIAFNNSNAEGGGIFNDGNLTMTSTIVADNSSNTTTNADFTDIGTSVVNDSIIGTGEGNSVTNNFVAGTPPAVPPTGNFVLDATSNPPPLNLNTSLQLASNGTEYLSFTGPSAAFGNGTNPNGLHTDQIGNPRSLPVANPTFTDIGSIETTTSVSSGVTFFLSSGKNGFVQVVNASTHATIQNFQPFAGYTGVVGVALGDLNGDGVPDIIVAAKGLVKIYDGASALVPGVNFNIPSTWSRLGSVTSTPVLHAGFTAIAGYAGALNIAAGDVNGDGIPDIIVGTAAGSQGRVAVFDGSTLSNAGAMTRIGGILTPFGTGFTGGVVVAAGDVTGNGPAEVIVGTQTKGDQVNIYQLQGLVYGQIGNTIDEFGTLPSTAQLQIATLDVAGLNVDDIAIGVISGGVGQVNVIEVNSDDSTSLVSHINVGGGLTAMAVSAYNTANSGADSLMIGTIPAGPVQFHVLNPTTGALISAFNELPALTGGIALAGV